MLYATTGDVIRLTQYRLRTQGAYNRTYQLHARLSDFSRVGGLE